MEVNTSDLRPGDLVLDKFSSNLHFMIIAVYFHEGSERQPPYMVVFNNLGTTQIHKIRRSKHSVWDIEDR